MGIMKWESYGFGIPDETEPEDLRPGDQIMINGGHAWRGPVTLLAEEAVTSSFLPQQVAVYRDGNGEDWCDRKRAVSVNRFNLLRLAGSRDE